MTAYPIPQVSFPVGTTIAGPFLTGGATEALITIDRTVPGGFNELDATSEMAATIQSSPDGVVWTDEVGCNWPGGIMHDHHYPVDPMPEMVLGVAGINPTSTQVRLIAVVTGPAPIVVAGSMTVT